MNDSPRVTDLGRLWRAWRNSLAGLRAAWRHEAAFRQELLATVALVPVAWWLGSGPLERALLIGVCLLVLVAELLNTAIEAAIDRIGPEHDPLSGRAKDLGSAAVLVALGLAALTWGGLALERLGG